MLGPTRAHIEYQNSQLITTPGQVPPRCHLVAGFLRDCDAHTYSEPAFTTPILRRLPNWARGGLGRPFTLFKLVAGVMWSKGYKVTDAEVRELHSAMSRHDGLFYLAAGAGFVADHKAQGDRLDFGHLFKAYRGEFPFLVGGSDEDPFEHRQVGLAQERLGKLGLQIERLPGGHLTTNEQPEALAALIAKFERGL
jgi:pimeloyl-ACP methyl ester carboxylesterase